MFETLFHVACFKKGFIILILTIAQNRTATPFTVRCQMYCFTITSMQDSVRRYISVFTTTGQTGHNNMQNIPVSIVKQGDSGSKYCKPA